MTQKRITVFIIDDNAEAVEILKIMLEKHFNVGVVGTASSPFMAIDGLLEKTADIIFLDIEMPSITGLEFCQMIRQQINPKTKVVFYSAHSKYVLNAMRQEAFDFLLKPPTIDDIGIIIKRYYENKLMSIASAVSQSECARSLLVVNYLNEMIRIDVEKCVLFRFRQEDNTWEVLCADGKSYSLRRRTNSDMILALTRNLVQINKRHIVNTRYVKKVTDNNCVMDVQVDDPDSLSISRSFKQSFLDAFNAI